MRGARLRSGLSLAEMADCLGWESKRYEMMEGGLAEPTPAELSLFARVVDTPADYLLTGRGSSGPDTGN